MKEALRLFSYSIPFVALMTVLSSLLQGFHTVKYTVYTRDILQQGANVLFIILFHFMNFKLSGIIYAFVLSHMLSILFASYYLTHLFPGIKDPTVKPAYEIRNLLSFSFPLLFVGVLQYLIGWIDTLMLGYWCSGQDVGIYRAAFQIPFIMTIFLMAANSIYAPLAADLYQRGEMERLFFVLKATTRWITYATVPFFILLAFSAKEVMLIFGQDYVHPGNIVLIVIAFGQLINCVSGSVGFTMTMTGRQQIELINSILLVVLCFLLNLWLIPKYGAVGAAIASCISLSLINIVRVIEIYYIFNVFTLSIKSIKIIYPTILSIIIIFILNNILATNYILLANTFIILIIFLLFYKTVLSDVDNVLIKLLKAKIIGGMIA
jgi:O-antigen/teichoic acid export membrane protein